MFALFFSLYSAMFTGTWMMYTNTQINNGIGPALSKVIQIITNIFNSTTTNISDVTFNAAEIITVVSLVLALITSIGIVVMAVKGIKRVFGVFFMGIRNI